jgi:tetrapyrrole methylase family protein/MazG family protein
VTDCKKGTKGGITLLGLGPGDPGALTREAWDWLNDIEVLYLRTKQHPTVKSLPGHLLLKSFDEIYEKAGDYETVYETIIQSILDLGGKGEDVTYAVPGHPFVAEATCPEIYAKAKTREIPVRVIEGLSFLEPTFLALGIDPFPTLFLADAMELSMHQTPGFPPSEAALIAQIYSQGIASDVKLTLMAAYPDEHPIKLIHNAGTKDELVENLPLYAIDQSPHLGNLSSLYISPLSEQASFESFQEIIARLRAPKGCPWDREQTHLSLRPFLLQETYEALDALDRGDMLDLQEELGDLLLQIFLHAQIATEEGDFNIHHVLDGVGKKLIRRHPHVFSDWSVDDVSGVIQNWEAIKAQERQENGESSKKGLLDGVPSALPALAQAQEIVERVGRVKHHQLSEMGQQTFIIHLIEEITDADEAKVSEIFGQILLGIASWAHQKDVDAESALREALSRFRAYFRMGEAKIAKPGYSDGYVNNDEKGREG